MEGEDRKHAIEAAAAMAEIDRHKADVKKSKEVVKRLKKLGHGGALLNKVKYNVIITTDKCYANNETNISFQEDAPLGGNDPYSSSKACAEIIVRSYLDSFYLKNNRGLATGRAGLSPSAGQ